MRGAGPQEQAECGRRTPAACALWGCGPQPPPAPRRRGLLVLGWVLAGVGWTGLYLATYVAPVAHWPLLLR